MRGDNEGRGGRAKFLYFTRLVGAVGDEMVRTQTLAGSIARAIGDDLCDEHTANFENYEGIMRFMRIFERTVDSLFDCVDREIKFCEQNNLRTDKLHELCYKADKIRGRVRDLALDMMNIMKSFETPDPPMPTEQEEKEAERERIEMYHRCGVKLPETRS